MTIHIRRILVCLAALAVILIASCSPEENTTTGATDLRFRVPQGNPATIDGVFSPQEWDGAHQIQIPGGDDQPIMFAMHDETYLYIGIRGESDPVTSICLDRGNRIDVLHSSAALGTIGYEVSGEVWNLIQEPVWQCRDTTDSASAQAERLAHLENAGWLASNGRMGNTTEVEYQIALTGSPMRVAVAFIAAPDYQTVVHWPAALGDDCQNLSLLTGPMPQQASFSPDQWLTLEIDN